jgi:ribosome-binding factor A
LKNRNPHAPQWRLLCHELREEDGLDPRLTRKKRTHPTRTRLGPLCKEVARALQLELSALSDDCLNELMVSEVVPAPDATRLRVTVQLRWSADDPHCRLVEDRLGRLNGYLRASVAQAITRKRTPELVFVAVSGLEVRP